MVKISKPINVLVDFCISKIKKQRLNAAVMLKSEPIYWIMADLVLSLVLVDIRGRLILLLVVAFVTLNRKQVWFWKGQLLKQLKNNR